MKEPRWLSLSLKNYAGGQCKGNWADQLYRTILTHFVSFYVSLCILHENYAQGYGDHCQGLCAFTFLRQRDFVNNSIIYFRRLQVPSTQISKETR